MFASLSSKQSAHAKSSSSSSPRAKSGRTSAKSAQFAGGNLAKMGASGVSAKEGEAAGAVMDDFASQTAENKSALNTAVTNAISMTMKAIANTKLGNATYMLYMDSGARADATDAAVTGRVATVLANLQKIKKSLEDKKLIFKKWDLAPDAKDANGNPVLEQNTYAYVRSGEQANNMYLGGVFWAAAPTGIDSQAGTVVHELSHREAGTSDHSYGVSKSKSNAASAPDKAATNADNYEHFAEMS